MILTGQDLLMTRIWSNPNCILNDQTYQAASKSLRGKKPSDAVLEAISSPQVDITTYHDRMIAPNIDQPNANPVASYLSDLTKLTHYVRELVEPAVRTLQSLPKDLSTEVKAKADFLLKNLQVKFDEKPAAA